MLGFILQFSKKYFQSSAILLILMIASEKSHQNLSDCNHFLLKKKFEVNVKQIFSGENMRNSGRYMYL